MLQPYETNYLPISLVDSILLFLLFFISNGCVILKSDWQPIFQNYVVTIRIWLANHVMILDKMFCLAFAVLHKKVFLSYNFII